ncbi:sulfurtransferase TusA family protein [Malonomonas rubra]|uniref:sulfurtransferase TusA family protein n=1 Tax=Malonomonas rubra TaxID=57040 RepID=UPI0026EC56AA|nr:sulfurtransferase TusA family protein [Malonomonas rubra]
MPGSNREIIEVDICGQICPSTLLTALSEINKHKKVLRTGLFQLNILTDNHDSTNRVSEAVGNMGYRVEIEERKSYYCIAIFKEP